MTARTSPGERIAALRNERGLTQQDASTKAGVAISTWSMLERGVIENPSMDTCQAVCRVLDCELADIWQWAKK